MEDKLVDTMTRALQNPDTALGTGERNTEIKIAFLVLWALGWDPVNEIALGAQIERGKLGDAKSSNAADFLVRDGAGKICVVGEAKHWFLREKAWETGRQQLIRYLNAVRAPRGFLTSGKTWCVIRDGKVLDPIVATDGRKLIDELRPHIGKGQVSGIDDPSVWDYAISPRHYAAKLRLTNRSSRPAPHGARR